MQTITFTCEVITPMFLAGADGQTPEIRPASIKGALRFWWRAMHGDRELDVLKRKEAEIFGGSGEKMGKSNFSIRILEPYPQSSSDPLPKRMLKTYGEKYKINILDYLAFGVSQYEKGIGNVLLRNYIGVGEKFVLKFHFKNEHQDDILKAFYLLSEYGGLGAKSRNGFGSFKIINASSTLPKVNIEDFKEQSPTSFSSISKETISDDSKDFDHWADALFYLGKHYQIARESIESTHNYHKRVLISQPIIVNKKEVKESIMKDGRHAKPYFMHVSKNDNGKYFGTLLSMPYNFLKDQIGGAHV